MNGTHYLVKYGPRREYRAYFEDKARAEQYVTHHENAVIVPLYEEQRHDVQSHDANRTATN